MFDAALGMLLAEPVRETVLGYHQKRLLGETAPTRYETRLRHRQGAVVDVEFNSGMMLYAGRPAVLITLGISAMGQLVRAEAE